MAKLPYTYPPAGTRKQGMGRELLTLAPLPLSTGYAPIPQQVNLKKATDATIDHGHGNFWGMEFGVRYSLTMVAVVFLVVFLSHLMFAYAERGFYPLSENYFITFIQLIPEMAIYYLCITGIIAFLMLISMLIAFRQASKNVPIRFNRQKRQVYAVVGKDHYIADWEAVNAQVESALLISPQSAVQYSSLVIQVPNHANGKQATLTASYPVKALAIADWEAIRVFMEEGLDALKQQSQTSPELDNTQLKELEANPQPTADYYEKLMKQYQAGSVKYFYAAKNQAKYSKSKLGYWGYNLWHIVTAWTLPCYLAQWLNKKHFVTYPPALTKWSKPIPEAQWAKPSQALIEQNKELQASYGKDGINNIQDYFTKHPVK